MRYMLLIYSAPDAGPEMGSPELEKEMEAWYSFTNEIAESGHLLGGDPLEGAETATTVRVRDGKTLVTDGPFAETKEILGGYYVIEAANLDEATAIAARIPNIGYGSTEVRPIRDLSG